MKTINLREKFSLFQEHWTPKVLGEVNDSYVKIFKAKGEFVWHKHDHEDEFFLVVAGQLKIKYREGEIVLNAGECCIIPRGVEHLPYAEEEAHVMLLEPKEVINTGDAESDKKVENPVWI